MGVGKPNIQSESVEQLMRVGQFERAIEKIETELGTQPPIDHTSTEQTSVEQHAHQDRLVELRYLLAVNYRYSGQFSKALDVLKSLRSLAPDHSRAMQEFGHLHRAMKQTDKAIEAFTRATQLNPGLIASWKAQAELLVLQGRLDQARQVETKIKRLMSTPKPLISVMELISQGKLIKAEELCRQFLRKNPTHVGGMRLLAQVGSQLGILEDAEFLLESALESAPHDNELRVEYLQVLRKRQKFLEAMEQAKHLLKSVPQNPQYQSLYAIECMQTGDYNTAIDTFDVVLSQLPEEPVTLTSQGHAYKTLGDQVAAIDCYRRALTSRARHCEAWYSLANLKTVQFEDADINAMEALKNDSMLLGNDYVYLNFALGKAYEDRQDYQRAFGYYNDGNRAKKAQSRYQAEQISNEFDRQKKFCDLVFAEQIAYDGHPAPDPIFIVGLPRAGSTLLEQILSSHSLVDGTLELPNILSMTHSLRRSERVSAAPQYPESLISMSRDQRVALGKKYLRDTQIHRRGAPYFIDKMPNNFRHIGFIKAILPNAKIIDARRSPMACCFSGFKQLFAEGQEFTYDLNDIGRYYKDYVALMDHWSSIFPDQILRVEYEQVVADTETQVRHILNYCGLSFEPQCLEFHTTKRAVRTASSEQVRQPINQRGLDQWRHFEPWLGPLKEALA